MTRHRDDDRPARYASPPCLLHEIAPDYAGLSDVGDPRRSDDVVRWRKAERERLINGRLAIPGDARRVYDAQIVKNRGKAVGDVRGLTVATYWPIRGEPDYEDS